MKKTKIIIASLLLTGLISCNDSDDGNNSLNAVIQGNWQLTRVSGGLTGVNHTFPDGLITWNFNANHNVNVFNGNTDQNLEDGRDTGNYTFNFGQSEVPETCNQAIYIDEVDNGCVTLTTNTLVIDQNYADGMKYEFSRILLETN